ncbi:hypothetical protein [Bacillus sp. BF9-10]|uniref:hypothetical protein n=1 Tax=Bacillus sp. BF9-10 TaxID=2217822 RepID=UPI0011C8946E|nr:hypothetical protein [Bacillus sp. BF9-10]TXR78304.1 hypothetical protein DN396_19745 [Bacillus sp. BF9-10]
MINVERDLENSSYNLRDMHDDMELESFSRISQQGSGSEINILSIWSNFEAELLIHVNGEEYGQLFIGKGVQNIPLNIQGEEGINIYARPLFAQDEPYKYLIHTF